MDRVSTGGCWCTHNVAGVSSMYVRVSGGCLRSVLPGVDIIRRATLTKSTLITEMFVVAPDNRMIVATPHEAGAACGAAANCQLYTLKHDYECTRSVAGCLCVPMCVCACVCACVRVWGKRILVFFWAPVPEAKLGLQNVAPFSFLPARNAELLPTHEKPQFECPLSTVILVQNHL